MSERKAETSGNALAIYTGPTGVVEVRLERDSVWLTQRQLAELLDTGTDNVGLHLRNIYAEGELDESATAEDFSVVRREGRRDVRRRLTHYNLDAVLSVGYRVSSAKATRFRQWATDVLRQHLTQGYSLDRQRLEANARELEAALHLVRRTVRQAAELTADDGRGLLELVTGYAQTFLLLQRYDEGLLAEPPVQAGGTLTGEVVINDVGLAALALLVAESPAGNKETMIRLVMNMLARPATTALGLDATHK